MNKTIDDKEMKTVKRFDILDANDQGITVAFWYIDGAKEIIDMDMEAVKQLQEGLEVRNE